MTDVIRVRHPRSVLTRKSSWWMSHKIIKSFVSSRGSRRNFAFREAVQHAIAEDGGLLLPKVIPQVQVDTLSEWRNLSFPELSCLIFKHFIDEKDISKSGSIHPDAHTITYSILSAHSIVKATVEHWWTIDLFEQIWCSVLHLRWILSNHLKFAALLILPRVLNRTPLLQSSHPSWTFAQDQLNPLKV